MSKRRSIEERAQAAESKALRARAEAEAVARPEVSIPWKALRDIDFLLADGEEIENVANLKSFREHCRAALKALGVEVQA